MSDAAAPDDSETGVNEHNLEEINKVVAMMADAHHGNAIKISPGVIFRRADLAEPLWHVYWGGDHVDVVNAGDIDTAGDFFHYINCLTDPQLDGGIPEDRRAEP